MTHFALHRIFEAQRAAANAAKELAVYYTGRKTYLALHCTFEAQGAAGSAARKEEKAMKSRMSDGSANLAMVRPGFVRPRGAASYCGVSPRTVRDWQHKRLLPYSRISRKCILIRLADLDALVARNRVEAIGYAAPAPVHTRPGTVL
jgi:hypothetical protein